MSVSFFTSSLVRTLSNSNSFLNLWTQRFCFSIQSGTGLTGDGFNMMHNHNFIIS